MNKNDVEKLMLVLEDDRTIYYNDNKKFNIEEINNRCRKYPNDNILVIIPDTSGITSAMLKKIDDNAYIRITGAYDDIRTFSQKHITFTDKKKQKNKSAVEFYFSTVIYEKHEAIKILEEIENIESKINDNWSDIQKLVYLYTTLKTKITYDPKFEDKKDAEVRSLRGLITKETVCSGYSLILKELLDRQNIPCYFVGGNKHAWNIVEIEGKLYAVDLTYENKNYRLGIQNSYTFLGQSPTIFNRTHKPSDSDPYKELHSRLCKLDKSFLKFIESSVMKEGEYEKTSFKCQRKNNQEFVVIQIGTKIINNEVYYTYYYDNIYDNKLSNLPLILTSKENISKYINNINFNKQNTITNNDIVEKLFNPENISDSLNKGSSYIGEIITYSEKHIHQLQKDKKDMELFNESPKVFPQNNGEILVVEKDSKNPILLNDIPVYKYNIYDTAYREEKPTLRKRIIYSDNDIIYSNIEEIQTKLLSPENIQYAINTNCGYVGHLNELKEVVYTDALIEYFESMEGITIEAYKKSKRR